MYLWFISFKTWMKTRHATPPWQADRLAKCQICPQLPLMLRHKRDIELLRRSPAMFVEYQLGLGPAWALFQELEWEEEAFKNLLRTWSKMKRRTWSPKNIPQSTTIARKRQSRRLSLVSCACCCAVPENPCKRNTQSIVNYLSNVQCYFLFLAWLTIVYKSRLHFHSLQTPNVRLLHCRETNIIWVLFTAYIKDS